MSSSSGKTLKSHSVKGSKQCLSLASTSKSRMSSRGKETEDEQNRRIDKQLRGRKPGDMIRMDREAFMHYAIYLGNDNCLDFTDTRGGSVTVTTIYEVIGDSNCCIDNYLDYKDGWTAFSPEEILKRAYAKITEVLTYSLGTFNCEHFCTSVRYGKAYCHQPCEVAATLLPLVQK